MLGWEEWSTKNEGLVAVFPCLEELHIKRCPKLMDVSLEALPLLKVLKINRCGDGVLRSLVQVASSITELDVKSISRLTDEVWRGVIKYLREVEELRIRRCNGIRYLWKSEKEARTYNHDLLKDLLGDGTFTNGMGKCENTGFNHEGKVGFSIQSCLKLILTAFAFQVKEVLDLVLLMMQVHSLSNVDDLKANTEFSGYSAASPVIQWFWEVVQGSSKEDKARLLQFVTGTSK
ncbi:hypothetical protein M8C21_015909, partial [Ambrosia artemisiifolia]